jgi:hypothetical protein
LKKVISKSKKANKDNDDMRPEYDLNNMTGGVRGKYYKSYCEGHTVKINKANGTTLVQRFKLEEGTVSIEPDLRKYFPDSESVNKALRCLAPLLTKKRKAKT